MSNDPLHWIDQELAALEAQGLRRELKARLGPQSAGRIVLEGRSLVNFGGNDYLGLAAEPRLAGAVVDATAEQGWGSGASPLVTGRSAVHARLEAELAEFEATEAALLFPTGYAANVGTIAALVGSRDVVFSDAKNHASIIDGYRLSKARVRVYPHNDVAQLERLLVESGRFRRRLIVTDGLFSMDGDLAPLGQLAELAQTHDAMLMVDEAHATGVFGRHGRGISEHLGVEDRVHVRVGTLSKALGSLGGFVVGSQRLVDWLGNRARSYVFSTAPPAAVAAAAIQALQIVRDEPDRRVDLLARADALRERLRLQGWNVGNSQSQIVPILVGDRVRTMELSAALCSRGLYVPGIRPPSVPKGESLLRISLSHAHTQGMIEQLLAALGQLRDEGLSGNQESGTC